MRIIDDWLDDWISERKHIMADDVVSLCARLRESAFSEGYSLAKLRDASDGDVDRFVRRVVVSRMMSDSAIAPLAPPILNIPPLLSEMHHLQSIAPAHESYKACVNP
ncbi:hypothetical protein PMI07_004816 [Rhizobium sp. CF080]|uniref:hypothetical protein n=1 Tax=Rhizobium sp. (strain CF080) TaxID=1144310 RepID=UPI000271CD0F|nr:hypothetical protein [Rhizobium sp. CF080]EUB98535.1 hypothetical protein PMI07_004816 [Rhizobium sp. CF080]